MHPSLSTLSDYDTTIVLSIRRARLYTGANETLFSTNLLELWLPNTETSLKYCLDAFSKKARRRSDCVRIRLKSLCGSGWDCESLPAGGPGPCLSWWECLCWLGHWLSLYGCHMAHKSLGLCRQPLHSSCLGTWPAWCGTGSWQREGKLLIYSTRTPEWL